MREFVIREKCENERGERWAWIRIDEKNWNKSINISRIESDTEWENKRKKWNVMGKPCGDVKFSIHAQDTQRSRARLIFKFTFCPMTIDDDDVVAITVFCAPVEVALRSSFNVNRQLTLNFIHILFFPNTAQTFCEIRQSFSDCDALWYSNPIEMVSAIDWRPGDFVRIFLGCSSKL